MGMATRRRRRPATCAPANRKRTTYLPSAALPQASSLRRGLGALPGVASAPPRRPDPSAHCLPQSYHPPVAVCAKLASTRPGRERSLPQVLTSTALEGPARRRGHDMQTGGKQMRQCAPAVRAWRWQANADRARPAGGTIGAGKRPTPTGRQGGTLPLPGSAAIPRRKLHACYSAADSSEVVCFPYARACVAGCRTWKLMHVCGMACLDGVSQGRVRSYACLRRPRGGPAA